MLTPEKLTGKTKRKVEKWTRELLDNEAIIGNISVRLDPTRSEYEVWFDDETGETCVTITTGVLDCAVDSLSRIKAILGAADNPLASFNLSTRFQVRIWMLDDSLAKKVATIYNTRGDKVNDSTAKYAYSETKEQELARRLVNGSEHLGQDNVEVLSNSVSASSHKLCAYNTISKAIETSWKGGPVTAPDIEAQSSWLISAWDSLVKARPEFGKSRSGPDKLRSVLHELGHAMTWEPLTGREAEFAHVSRQLPERIRKHLRCGYAADAATRVHESFAEAYAMLVCERVDELGMIASELVGILNSVQEPGKPPPSPLWRLDLGRGTSASLVPPDQAGRSAQSQACTRSFRFGRPPRRAKTQKIALPRFAELAPSLPAARRTRLADVNLARCHADRDRPRARCASVPRDTSDAG